MFGCIETPDDENCRDFQLPPTIIDESIMKLCKSMPNMPGCYLNDNCNPTLPNCSKFSILASICKYDMPKMHECNTYTKMCSSDSIIRQCQQLPPIGLPTSKQTKSLINSICSEMDMSDCDCKENCNFSTYLHLCQQMPNMNQCFEMNQLCKFDFPFCSKTSSVPSMKMYFHFGISDYLLFESIVPSTYFQYLLALVFCTLFGIFYEYLVHSSVKFEQVVASVIDQHESSDPLLPEMVNVSRDQSIITTTKIRLFRSLFRFVILVTGYLAMFIAMTFNIGYFISITMGIAIGTFLFNDSSVIIEHCR